MPREEKKKEKRGTRVGNFMSSLWHARRHEYVQKRPANERIYATQPR